MLPFMFIFIGLTVLTTSTAEAQTHHITDEGQVSFISDTHLEDIKATSGEMRALPNVKLKIPFEITLIVNCI